MFFIPLNQIESVQLVLNALRTAGGQADCSTCPARRGCTKQCLAIADAVVRMLEAGTLPALGEEPPPAGDADRAPSEGKSGKKEFLKVIK